MNRVFICFIVLLSLLGIPLSCGLKDFDPLTWSIAPELELSESGVVFYSGYSHKEIFVETNFELFSISSSEDWCYVQGYPDKKLIEINASPNRTDKQRTSTVTITVERGATSFSRDIFVIQLGGIYDIVGPFEVYWEPELGESRKKQIADLLNNMVFVKGGSFSMGSQDHDPNASNYDPLLPVSTVHEVTVSDYYICKYEFTHKWLSEYGTNHAYQVSSWDEVIDIIQTLINYTGLSFTLPTEAQWEYAAIGGEMSEGHPYAGSDNLSDVSDWSNDDTLVGQYQANELGLYDMTGNLWELCLDFWENDYIIDVIQDPIGPSTGYHHVIRGGCDDVRLYLYGRTRFRTYYTENTEKVGFRLVINP